jgi:hypothetical protein
VTEATSDLKEAFNSKVLASDADFPAPIKAHTQETINLISWRARKVTRGEEFMIPCFYRPADMSGPTKFLFFPVETLQPMVFGGLVMADQGKVWPHCCHLKQMASNAIRRMGQDLESEEEHNAEASTLVSPAKLEG